MATKKKRVSKTTKAAAPAVKRKTSSRKNTDFWKIEFNINTIYWVVIGLAVISTAAWTYNTNQQISDIYDNVDQTNASIDTPVPATSTSSKPAY